MNFDRCHKISCFFLLTASLSGIFHLRGLGGQQRSFPLSIFYFYFYAPNGLEINFRLWNFSCISIGGVPPWGSSSPPWLHRHIHILSWQRPNLLQPKLHVLWSSLRTLQSNLATVETKIYLPNSKFIIFWNFQWSK